MNSGVSRILIEHDDVINENIKSLSKGWFEVFEAVHKYATDYIIHAPSKNTFKI